MSELSGKNYQSPRVSYEYLDCSLPLTFDTYSACSFNCLYCFAFYQRAMNSVSAEDFWERKITSVDPEHVKYLLTEPETKVDKNALLGALSRLIAKKVPLHWGGLSDPGDEYERQFGVGLEIIKHLRSIEYPTLFSTKGDTFIQKEYLEQFQGSKNFKFQFSIISADNEKARKIEQGCPTPDRRFEVMNTLHKAGCEVMLRFRPFIIGFSDKTMEEVIVRSKEAGATAMSMEFFCLESRAAGYLRKRYEEMNQVMGFDIYDYYKHLSLSTGGGYKRLNPVTKAKYVERAYKLAKKLGMRFACSDAHWKELNDTGCCCGLGNEWGWSRGQYTNVLIKARKCGQVCWKDVEDGGVAWGENLKFSEVRNCGNWKKYRRFKKLDCTTAMKNVWNDPENPASPYQYFNGRMKPKGLDAQGNVVYEYSKHELEDKIVNEDSDTKQGQG